MWHFTFNIKSKYFSVGAPYVMDVKTSSNTSNLQNESMK